MKKASIYFNRVGSFLFLYLLAPCIIFAQDKIVVDKESWVQRHWIIVGLGVLVLILLFALAGRTKTRRTTTTVTKDEGDRVKSVTTVREE